MHRNPGRFRLFEVPAGASLTVRGVREPQTKSGLEPATVEISLLRSSDRPAHLSRLQDSPILEECSDPNYEDLDIRDVREPLLTNSPRN
jgi:hypothetical protein